MEMEDGLSFDGMKEVEIREYIERYVREMRHLDQEKKDYNAGVKEVMKDIKARVNAALAALDSLKAGG